MSKFPGNRLRTMRSSFLAMSAGLVVLAISGCAGPLPMQRLAQGERRVVVGTPPRNNVTPFNPAFSCLAREIHALDLPRLDIAVGEIKDYTGKYSTTEGNAITQGGALMAYSALGKLGSAVRIHERLDTHIAELELAYADRRELGDGKMHVLKKGEPEVPWIPYYGGSILASRYYIVGGITEANYDISSGGAQFQVNGVGPQARTYTMDIGVDLRLVDTKTLIVKHTVSITKQITGEEVGAGIFDFFGTNLFYVNAGSKHQEPLQFGIRTAIEEGILDLVSEELGLNPKVCILDPTRSFEAVGAVYAPGGGVSEAPRNAEAHQAVIPQNLSSQSVPINLNGGSGSGKSAAFKVLFEFNSTEIDPQSSPLIDQIATMVGHKRVAQVELVAHDTELLAPAARLVLSKKRVASLISALRIKGIAEQRVRVTWLPDSTDPAIRHDGAGYEVAAVVSVQ